MFKVELYGRVRRAVLADGRSQRLVARDFEVSRAGPVFNRSDNPRDHEKAFDEFPYPVLTRPVRTAAKPARSPSG
jgi:hypothetical protein